MQFEKVSVIIQNLKQSKLKCKRIDRNTNLSSIKTRKVKWIGLEFKGNPFNDISERIQCYQYLQ